MKSLHKFLLPLFIVGQLNNLYNMKYKTTVQYTQPTAETRIYKAQYTSSDSPEVSTNHVILKTIDGCINVIPFTNVSSFTIVEVED